MVLFNGLLTFFTFCLVFLGWWQMRAHIEPVPLVIPNFSLTPLVAPISIADAGSTPAYQVDAKIWCASASPKFSQGNLKQYELEHPAGGGSAATIYPHSSQFGLIRRGTPTPDQVRDIIADKQQVYLFGTIRYRTMWLWQRYSNFCFHLSGEDWKRQLWSACLFYNDAN